MDTTFLKKEVPVLLEKLELDMQPLWGKMSPQHMLEHLSMAISFSNGRMSVSLAVDKAASEKAHRSVFEYKNNFPKSLPIPGIPTEPLPLMYSSFTEAKTGALGSIAAFFEHFDKDPSRTCVHPVLGALTYDEWIYFNTKHVSHHLSQFGLLEAEIHL